MDSSLDDLIRQKRNQGRRQPPKGRDNLNNRRKNQRFVQQTPSRVLDVRDRIINKRKESFGDARQAILSRKISRVKDARTIIKERHDGMEVEPSTDLRKRIEIKKMVSNDRRRVAEQSAPSLMDVDFSKPPPMPTRTVANKIHANASFFPGGIPDGPTLIKRTLDNVRAMRAAEKTRSSRRMEYESNSEEEESPLPIPPKVIKPARLALVVENPHAKPRAKERASPEPINPVLLRRSVAGERPAPIVKTEPAPKKAERAPLTTASLRSSVAKPDAQVPPSSYVKVTNLHEDVSQNDIQELFSRVGRLIKANLIKPGTAEIYFLTPKDAAAAVNEYHERLLDGLPMEVKILPPPKKSAAEKGKYAVPDVSTIHMALNKAKANASSSKK